MGLVLVGIGGALGSITRYKLGKVIAGKIKSTFPAGTFLINMTGAILLGIVISLKAGNSIYLLLGDGFLGAFTTFSTFMYEGFNMFRDNREMNAFVYIAGSMLLGIAGYAAGAGLALLIK